MARGKKKSDKKPIEQYDHKGKERLNNPPVGLVTPETDKETGKKKYAYDPHLDPSLQWAGKAEHTAFEVPTISLHVHERIDPRTVIQAVRKKNGNRFVQGSLFQSPEENPPLRDAIEFYKHKHNWSNRLIAGDSLLVMNSLIEKEGLAGQVQMIYFDPPYGIKYGSNFQPFVNKRDVKDGKDEDLTQEPEMIKAFRDTWELGIHSYLTYLRDRLLLARDLLHESGSIFVQISDENVHLVRNLMDEVFGVGNFISIISFRKTGSIATKYIGTISDFLVCYAKDKEKLKFRKLFVSKKLGSDEQYNMLMLKDGQPRKLTYEESRDASLVQFGAKLFQATSLQSDGRSPDTDYRFEFEGEIYEPNPKSHWKTSIEGLKKLAEKRRIIKSGKSIRYVRYFDDFPFTEITNVWSDVYGASEMRYVVETSDDVISRCLLMTTDPGDVVLDITCGSGTTAYVAEQWGRRWITCDTSRVSITLAKQRLMTALFDYYDLAYPQEGVGSGFRYKTVPHITLKSIANNEPPGRETLYDQPFVDNSRARVTGPFTVEAVPAPIVKPLNEMDLSPSPLAGEGWCEWEMIDSSIARSGETLRQAEWRDELLKCGIRGKNNQYILFSRVEPLPGTRWLHADAETKSTNPPNPPLLKGGEGGLADRISEKKASYGQPERVVISFGPEHAPLEQRQVALAIEEAQKLVPKPKIIVFASFQFDPEAAKDIDETIWPGVTLLKVQMNTDLLTDDLKKKRASNESFWLMGQPEVRLSKVASEKGSKTKKPKDDKTTQYQVEVLGFDYYNTKTGNIESGGTDKIAMWMLDTDYDGRSLFPRQVFFPMAGEKDGWARLAKNLKAEIDEELIEAYRGNVSLPFEIGDNRRIAVKIVDDRGIESLKILEVE